MALLPLFDSIKIGWKSFKRGTYSAGRDLSKESNRHPRHCQSTGDWADPVSERTYAGSKDRAFEEDSPRSSLSKNAPNGKEVWEKEGRVEFAFWPVAHHSLFLKGGDWGSNFDLTPWESIRVSFLPCPSFRRRRNLRKCLRRIRMSNAKTQMSNQCQMPKSINNPSRPPLRLCHTVICEGVKRPKQSHKAMKTMRLPRSLRSLATTNIDCDTVSLAKGGLGDLKFELWIWFELWTFSFEIYGLNPCCLSFWKNLSWRESRGGRCFSGGVGTSSPCPCGKSRDKRALIKHFSSVSDPTALGKSIFFLPGFMEDV